MKKEYLLSVGFAADRELSDAEIEELKKRVLLEIEEPLLEADQTKNGNFSISSPAEWSSEITFFSFEQRC